MDQYDVYGAGKLIGRFFVGELEMALWIEQGYEFRKVGA